MPEMHVAVTEREARLRERKAFVEGATWRFLRFYFDKKHTLTLLEYDKAANTHFPLPTITRPRVVRDGVWEFRVQDGQLQTRLTESTKYGGGNWGCIENIRDGQGGYLGLAVTPARVKLWADLIANPNETVEEV